MSLLQRLRPQWMRWFRDYSGHHREGSPHIGRELVYLAINSGQNDKLIVFVAALGFFVDSYILFATNVINPILGYIYWHDSTRATHEFSLNVVTLCGCIFGQLVFGWLGDQYGRRKVYGWELLVLMIGTIGVLMSSTGYVPPYSQDENSRAPDWGTLGSMNVYWWLLWFRFCTGCGIGGDYPLSSVLVSEFAPTRRRAWMLSVVFSMQSLGYAAASIVSIIVVSSVRAYQGDPLDPNDPASKLTTAELSRSADQIWRWILGVALLPGIIAMVLRLNVPESPRYVMDIINDTEKAFEETNRFKQAGLETTWKNALQLEHINQPTQTTSSVVADEKTTLVEETVLTEQSFTGYLFGGPQRWYRRNWTMLAGTTFTWFALDLAFFGLSLNSPGTIAKIWWYAGDPLGTPGLNTTTPIQTWNTDFDLVAPGKHIYEILITSNYRSLITTSIGAILGSAIMVFSVWHWKLNQKKWQIISFAILTVLLIVTGVTFVMTVGTANHSALVVLYILCALFFNFGPNTLTFIISAQLFPTRYRATCAGISAAAGKLGSVIIQAFLSYAQINGQSASSVVDKSGPSKWLGYALMVCALPMLAGAIATHFWIPDLQTSDGQHLTLEELNEVELDSSNRTHDEG